MLGVIRFSILNFINESKKRCAPFILYLNFINASGKRCDQQEWNMFKIHFTIPKFFYKSLNPTGSCL
jgi:hypothetical protein